MATNDLVEYAQNIFPFKSEKKMLFKKMEIASIFSSFEVLNLNLQIV